jgi:hypothetical protein
MFCGFSRGIAAPGHYEIVPASIDYREIISRCPGTKSLIAFPKTFWTAPSGSSLLRKSLGGEMRTSPEKKSKAAMQVARMGLPPSRAHDGLVELSIQEYAAKTRRVIENYPADRIPKVGDEIKSDNGDGTAPDTFVVMEVKHLLVPRTRETIRAVLLLVKRPHQV